MGQAQLGWYIKKGRGTPDWLVQRKGKDLITEKEVRSLNIDLYLWSPIHKNYCTLNELKTIYDIDDLMAMHESIAVFNKLEQRAKE